MTSLEDKQLDVMPLFSANLSLILHKSHQWSKLKKIGLEKITELNLVLPSSSFSREATIIFPAGIYRKVSILLFHNLIKKKAEMTNLA
ncbi:hypothetical protein [Flavobacterium sp. KJJ]|uniref:hypothetical protein n=1 Tax=Flavobacterium sp. KJJ TaxID=1270193 RepID=UPI0004936A54|nr:hypothetical protein [Flavobacterium sp. KJJ]